MLWLDVNFGMIAATDWDGHIALVNYEGEIIWRKRVEGAGVGWMVKCFIILVVNLINRIKKRLTAACCLTLKK